MNILLIFHLHIRIYRAGSKYLLFIHLYRYQEAALFPFFLKHRRSHPFQLCLDSKLTNYTLLQSSLIPPFPGLNKVYLTVVCTSQYVSFLDSLAQKSNRVSLLFSLASCSGTHSSLGFRSHI